MEEKSTVVGKFSFFDLQGRILAHSTNDGSLLAGSNLQAGGMEALRMPDLRRRTGPPGWSNRIRTVTFQLCFPGLTGMLVHIPGGAGIHEGLSPVVEVDLLPGGEVLHQRTCKQKLQLRFRVRLILLKQKLSQ